MRSLTHYKNVKRLIHRELNFLQHCRGSMKQISWKITRYKLFLNGNTYEQLQGYFYVEWVIDNIFIFIFRGNIGIKLGDCHFQRFANERESTSNLVAEALMKASRLQLLVVILPGKTPFYGRYYLTFPSSSFGFKNCWSYSGSWNSEYDRRIKMVFFKTIYR